MRSVLANIIVEKLAELGEGTLEAFFPKNYAYTALWRPLLGLDKRKKITRHSVSSCLWELQRQGLVERKGPARKSAWTLTKKGKAYSGLHKRKKEEQKKDGITRLVIFDIPERERRKRTIIRTELVACKFSQLQKSVWIGAYALPKTFIALMDDLELHGKLHVFSIAQRGTIKKNL
ncbi:MAG: hypothetical protein HY617_01650 [Candidatus Sungbacteria bacterium]|nr:hypothetical protein [Candidatus Sungbacteria bacterium]